MIMLKQKFKISLIVNRQLMTPIVDSEKLILNTYECLIGIYHKKILKIINVFYNHITVSRSSRKLISVDIMWLNDQRNVIVSKNKVCVLRSI